MARETYLDMMARQEHESFVRAITRPPVDKSDYVSPERMRAVVDALVKMTSLTNVLLSKAILNPHSFVVGENGETVQETIDEVEDLVRQANM